MYKYTRITFYPILTVCIHAVNIFRLEFPMDSNKIDTQFDAYLSFAFWHCLLNTQKENNYLLLSDLLWKFK